MRPSLTALSQTGDPSADTDALIGLSADLDLHNRIPADSPDIRHEIKDQKGWAPNLSERAQLSGPFHSFARDLSGCFGSHAGTHERISSTEQGSAHGLGRRPVVTFEQVTVHVFGDRDAGVPEHVGDHVQRRALGPSISEAPEWRSSCGCQWPSPDISTA